MAHPIHPQRLRWLLTPWFLWAGVGCATLHPVTLAEPYHISLADGMQAVPALDNTWTLLANEYKTETGYYPCPGFRATRLPPAQVPSGLNPQATWACQ